MKNVILSLMLVSTGLVSARATADDNPQYSYEEVTISGVKVSSVETDVVYSGVGSPYVVIRDLSKLNNDCGGEYMISIPAEVDLGMTASGIKSLLNQANIALAAGLLVDAKVWMKFGGGHQSTKACWVYSLVLKAPQ